MQLIILGKTSDDKGTQLEKLTVSLLEEQGYSSVHTNVVNAGASEIDITATFTQPFLTNAVSHEVIGECKAYSRPVAIPDWLKFLGKIFSEEVNGKKVQGCFIALSGATGTVIGHYKSLRTSRPDIQLIEGDDLYKLLHQNFDVQNVTEIQAIIQTLTEKQPVNYALCYYDKKFYWCISFSDKEYTMLNGEGKAIGQKEAGALHAMIILQSELSTYIDIEHEKTATERIEMINRYVLSALLIEKQRFAIKDLLAKTKAHFSDHIKSLKQAEVKAAINTLEGLGLVNKIDGKYDLTLYSDRCTVEDVVAFYAYFTRSTIVLKGLHDSNYGFKLDEKVLEHIIATQGDVQIPAEKHAECLQLIRWSPSALAWGLTPDPFIVNHRFNGQTFDKRFDKHDTDYFVRKVYEQFMLDFNNQLLNSYFFNLGLRDLEITSTITITKEDSGALSNQSHVRIVLGKMSEEYNNQIISMMFIDPDATTKDIDPSKTGPLQ